MASYTLYPPVVENYIPAFLLSDNKITIQFSLSNLNSLNYFTSVHAVVYDAKAGKSIVNLSDSEDHYRKTGIILNLAYRDLGSNLYEVDILKEDILPSAWNNAGLNYKIQLRLSTMNYNPDSGVGQADWINANAGAFSEWSSAIYTKSIASISYQLNLIDQDLIYPSNFLILNGEFNIIPSSEIVKECYFVLYDFYGNELERSETLVLENTQNFYYEFETELENSIYYKLSFYYITNNLYEGGFELTSFLVQYNEITPLYYALKTLEDGIQGTNLITEEEEGYIALKIKPTGSNYPGLEEEQYYEINIRRSDSEHFFKKWITIKQIKGTIDTIEKLPIIIDNTIESQVFYQYKLQVTKINQDEDVISPSFGETQKIVRTFDHTYLLGDKRQLKLKFNTNISNFNYQVVESKIDPLGSKYPIVTRNGATYYRTFPINGLISFQLDEQELFYTQDELYGSSDIKQLYKNKYYPGQTSNKIYNDMYDVFYEKKFREKVIQFLYDGKIKLFKSPTEGNILVRLMNVSFAPNQTLGRMIYTFSCTACEIGEVNMDNLLNNNILNNYIYDENSIIPDPEPMPIPDPDYRVSQDPLETTLKIVDSAEKNTFDTEIQIINSDDVIYHESSEEN